LAAVRTAGCDRVAWSHAHGVDARSLNAWRVALERRALSRRTPALVELVPSSPASLARYVIDLGAARIEIDDRCSADTLQRVVRALRAC
jgi:hypothetical protein